MKSVASGKRCEFHLDRASLPLIDRKGISLKRGLLYGVWVGCNVGRSADDCTRDGKAIQHVLIRRRIVPVRAGLHPVFVSEVVSTAGIRKPCHSRGYCYDGVDVTVLQRKLVQLLFDDSGLQAGLVRIEERAGGAAYVGCLRC